MAHNASFDVNIINRELFSIGYPSIARFSLGIIDTLTKAKVLFNKRCSLDYLCDRFKIPRTKRIKHGALVDARLLADVFIVLNRISPSTLGYIGGCGTIERTALCKRLPLIAVSSVEQQLHQNILNEIDSLTFGNSIW